MGINIRGCNYIKYLWLYQNPCLCESGQYCHLALKTFWCLLLMWKLVFISYSGWCEISLNLMQMTPFMQAPKDFTHSKTWGTFRGNCTFWYQPWYCCYGHTLVYYPQLFVLLIAGQCANKWDILLTFCEFIHGRGQHYTFCLPARWCWTHCVWTLKRYRFTTHTSLKQLSGALYHEGFCSGCGIRLPPTKNPDIIPWLTGWRPVMRLSDLNILLAKGYLLYMPRPCAGPISEKNFTEERKIFSGY